MYHAMFIVCTGVLIFLHFPNVHVRFERGTYKNADVIQ